MNNDKKKDKIANSLDIPRRRPHQHLKPPLLRNPLPSRRVKVPYRIVIQRDSQVPRFAGLGRHLLKRTSSFSGRGSSDFSSWTYSCAVLAPSRAHIADGHRELDALARPQHLGAERRPPILELRVREPVTEGEQRRHAHAVVVPVAGVESPPRRRPRGSRRASCGRRVCLGVAWGRCTITGLAVGGIVGGRTYRQLAAGVLETK